MSDVFKAHSGFNYPLSKLESCELYQLGAPLCFRLNTIEGKNGQSFALSLDKAKILLGYLSEFVLWQESGGTYRPNSQTQEQQPEPETELRIHPQVDLEPLRLQVAIGILDLLQVQGSSPRHES